MAKLENTLSKVALFLFSVRVANLVLPHIIWQIIFFITKNPSGITLSWNRWDAPHYLYIAQNGYSPTGDEANFIVFQPLFPLMVRITSFLIPNLEFAAIWISIGLFTLAGCLFFETIRKEFGNIVAWYSIIILGLFPTAYFFNAPYTESLFFFFMALLLYLAQKKSFLLASVAGGLAVLTRHIGVFLFLPLFFEWLRHRKAHWHFLPFLPIGFIIAISIYLFINNQVLGDPLAFNTILKEHWHKSPALFWESVRGSWLAARAWPPTNYSLMIGLAEALPATIGLALIPLIYKLKKWGWFLYYGVYVIFICSTSFLLSTSRYMLLAFPLFILLAKLGQRSRIFFYSWLFISVTLLSFFSLQFISGQWAF